MPKQDQILHAIGAIYAAGFDETLWPPALAAMIGLVGAVGATFEVIDRDDQLLDFWSMGVPADGKGPYMDHYLAINPRRLLCRNRSLDEIGYDYLMMDDAALDRHPYYQEFLRPIDLRYYVAATIFSTSRLFAAVSVHRSDRQGHVGAGEIATLRHVLPHLRQAFDVGHRLRTAKASRTALEQGLHWLPDGVVLVGSDGVASYLNEAALDLLRRRDGIHLGHGRLGFQDTEARGRYETMLSSVQALAAGDHAAPAGGDFPVRRPSGLPPYMVSVRPIPTAGLAPLDFAGRPMALVFVRDPSLQDGRSLARRARAMFGLTAAEASFAEALVHGISVADYARTRRVGLNTVYTHLRHIKAKIGARRMPELIGRLTELRAPLLSEEQRRDLR